MFCQSCGSEVASSYKICPQCGGKQFGTSHPQVSPPKAHIAPPPPTQVQGFTQANTRQSTPPGDYATFWRRLGAFMIDGIVLTLIFIPLFILVGASFAIPAAMDSSGNSGLGLLLTVFSGSIQIATLLFVLPWLYFAFMESGAKQSTLGKRWLGMKVTDENGQRVSFGLASGRYFAKSVLSGIFMIGYLMALFTERRQALHDKMAGTYVLYFSGR